MTKVAQRKIIAKAPLTVSVNKSSSRLGISQTNIPHINQTQRTKGVSKIRTVSTMRARITIAFRSFFIGFTLLPLKRLSSNFMTYSQNTA